mmetsp:Transcript_21716/g.49421  ORF Transcript_21716/g.49421 Transcript_21716/m.49421 type:complete len:227 (+) Transcript_21716:34-714(+)
MMLYTSVELSSSTNRGFSCCSLVSSDASKFWTFPRSCSSTVSPPVISSEHQSAKTVRASPTVTPVVASCSRARTKSFSKKRGGILGFLKASSLVRTDQVSLSSAASQSRASSTSLCKNAEVWTKPTNSSSVSSGLVPVVIACKARATSSGNGGLNFTGSVPARSCPSSSAKNRDLPSVSTLLCTGTSLPATRTVRSLSQQTSGSRGFNKADGGYKAIAHAWRHFNI